MRIIALDCETTGLDTTKDEPIQIGFIEYDENFSIIQEFQSYIKPKKNISELKNIVSFITGLNLKDLETAPSIEELIPTLQKIFIPGTLIIWHNIAFDLAMLKKYVSIEGIFSIDTHPLSQAIFHHIPSYSLETLLQHCPPDFKEKNTYLLDGSASAHDALYDSKLATVILKFFLEKTQKLAEKYELLSSILHDSKRPIIRLLKTQHSDSELSLPTLSKTNNSATIPLLDQTKNLPLPSATQLYSEPTKLKNFFKNLLATKEKYIIAVSNKFKLDIIKNAFHGRWEKNLWFFRDDTSFDEDMVARFIAKKEKTPEEILFCIKYFSLYDKGRSVLDLNTPSDHQIFFALKNTKKNQQPNIILWTHSSLYFEQESWNLPTDHTIIFADSDRRYKSYNFYLNQKYDFYYLIQLIENILYKQKLKNLITENIEKLLSFSQILTGTIFIEIAAISKNQSNDFFSVHSISENHDFHKTNKLFWHIQTYLKNCKSEITPEDFLLIKKNLGHLESIVNDEVFIEKKLYNQTGMYFLLQKNNQFTNFWDFLHIFKNQKIFFVSHHEKKELWVEKLVEWPNQTTVNRQPNITVLSSQSSILSTITGDSLFILANSKQIAQWIFDELFKKNLHKEYTIIVENITGSAGKCIAMCKQSPKKIVIWGYDFILNSFSHQIKFDKYLILTTINAFQKLVLDDVIAYGSQ